MNFKRTPLFFLILLFFPTLTQGISISCDCSGSNCHCTSDCSFGLLDIYTTTCTGSPNYELSISGGKTKWLAPPEGQYYLKVLCDNHKKSGCELIKVPSTIVKKGPEANFLPYLFLLSLILLTGLLLHASYQKKKELSDIKKEVKR